MSSRTPGGYAYPRLNTTDIDEDEYGALVEWY
jgi:hypothetical protein